MKSASQIELKKIIGTNYIKLNKLKELIGTAFAGSKATQCNMYIDLYSILGPIYRSNVLMDYTLELSYLILDMCIHYKKFFRGIGVNLNIFIIYSNNIPPSSVLRVPEYNISRLMLLTSEINKTIATNLIALKTLTEYIDGYYFVETEYESSVCIAGIIKAYNNIPSIILSKDPYPLLVAATVDNTVYLRPSKSKGEDVSRISYNNKTVWDEFLTQNGSNYDKEILIDPKCMSSVIAMTRFACRGLKSLISTRTVLDFSNNLIKSESCSADSIHYNLLCSYIDKVNNSDMVNMIDSRYKVLDIEYQLQSYLSSIEFKELKFQDRTDNDSLKHINNEYYGGLLDLDNL